MARFYAHTTDGPVEDWELLDVHLRRVAGDDPGFAHGAAQFAQTFGAAEWGRLLGLWHDLGKYSAEFQAYLFKANGGEAHLETHPGRVDHSTAGARHAARTIQGLPGKILAYCIAGHHAGLPDDSRQDGGLSGLASRLDEKQKTIPNYSPAPAHLLKAPPLALPQFTWQTTDYHACAFQASVFCRMLFSCLVDADYLATEAFMRPDQSAERPRDPASINDLSHQLNAYLSNFSADTPVNEQRANVLRQCREKAELRPGVFSLTVPTGGGKTLSSLAFALKHACKYDLRRVIYAIPFTSIIEQNVDVFNEALAGTDPDVVLEHHSNLDPEKEKESLWGRLAAENWDAPLIVTTNVQFFESLFANKTSRCRKLHRIARSVIILDECQTLPVTLLEPTLRMLEELCRNYGCTVVLCSATQPAVAKRTGFEIGLTDVREIVDDPDQLHESLQRVDVSRIGKIEDDALIDQLLEHEQVLCIVNTRGHAAKLFHLLRERAPNKDALFHLSAQMCAAHRTDILKRIRTRLSPHKPDPCVVISTQLVEAGVDIDFPVVYRAMTGLDSIAQAAGRCNREGTLHQGKVYVFDTDVDPRGDLRQRRQTGDEVADLHKDDILSLAAINHFFELTYWARKDQWDKENILPCFTLSPSGPHFQFREAAEKYRLIPDAQTSVIVPYGETGRALIDQLSAMPEPPGRAFARKLQRYIVGVYDWQLTQLQKNQTISQQHERFWILTNETAYDDRTGLQLDVAGFDPGHLFV